MLLHNINKGLWSFPGKNKIPFFIINPFMWFCDVHFVLKESTTPSILSVTFMFIITWYLFMFFTMKLNKAVLKGITCMRCEMQKSVICKKPWWSSTIITTIISGQRDQIHSNQNTKKNLSSTLYLVLFSTYQI